MDAQEAAPECLKSGLKLKRVYASVVCSWRLAMARRPQDSGLPLRARPRGTSGSRGPSTRKTPSAC
eukprot:127934-Alexandrium_andersonii.AAC.1